MGKEVFFERSIKYISPCLPFVAFFLIPEQHPLCIPSAGLALLVHNRLMHKI